MKNVSSPLLTFIQEALRRSGKSIPIEEETIIICGEKKEAA